MEQPSPGPSVEPDFVPGGSLPSRRSKIASGALVSGLVGIAAWLVAMATGRVPDSLFLVYVVGSAGGVVLGIAGLVVTRGRRLNGQILALAGLMLGALGALFFVPLVLVVATNDWMP
ncbi:MAG: hypothetical protein LBU50_04635 [Cellulomonas sp.]|jgi:hypothetical protein|nr:hypothetical protein [Cellulomonas sp.]